MRKFYFLILFCLAINFLSNAQGWEHTYPSIWTITNVFEEESGFAFIGDLKKDGWAVRDSVILFKTDLQGDSTWSKVINLETFSDIKCIKIKDGGFVIAGTYLATVNEIDTYLIKINSVGDTVWTKKFGIPDYDYGISVAEAEDSNLVLIGNMPAPGGIRFIKTDKNGKLLVDKNWGEDGIGYRSYDIKVLSDGSYIVLGSNYGTPDGIYLAKLDKEGNIMWDKNLGVGNGMFTFASSLDICNDGGFILGGYVEQMRSIFKVDNNGNLLWYKTYPSPHYSQIYSVKQTSDQGFIFTVATYEGANGDSTGVLLVVKTDTHGGIIWTTKKPYDPGGEGYSIIQTSDLGYLLGGSFYEKGGIYLDGNFIKLDINGEIYENTMSGNLYYDQNNNCVKDIEEPPLINWLVKLQPSNRFVFTDSMGNYSFQVNKGNYTTTPVMKNSVWSQKCSPSSSTFNFTSFNEASSGNDFGIAAENCPFLKVDVITPRLFRCFRNTTYVHYCNEGAIAVNDAQIVVQFPSSMMSIASSIPYEQSGNIYKFNIDQIQPGERGLFTITDSLVCDVPLGSTQCVKATILPINQCQAPNPNWDKSSISVEGVCQGDSVVKFRIINDGTGNMEGTSSFRIFFNNVLDSIGTFQLHSQDTLTILVGSQGKTVRLEADQRPNHPGKSMPRATVEGCNSEDFGYLQSVPQDDEDDFVEIDCQTVMGSFDPNEKTVVPQGITKNHYIPTSCELEYTIRFQNTGTDTAYNVVVKDAISNNLDVSTFKMVSASHTYSYKIIPGPTHIIEWKFENIKLPDSNVNESKSHGYLKYKILQKNKLTAKSLIENTAAIYFDYNEPVFTNTTRSIVFDTVIDYSKATSIIPWTSTSNYIHVYPNPTSDKATIEIEANNKNIDVFIFDGTGKLYKHISRGSTNKVEISVKDELPEGIYIYKVFSDDELLGTGKLVLIK